MGSRVPGIGEGGLLSVALFLGGRAAAGGVLSECGPSWVLGLRVSPGCHFHHLEWPSLFFALESTL